MLEFIFPDIIFIVLAYLLGSIESAIIVCRVMGLPDPREKGSHNPGATNVMRIGGKSAAAATFLGDVLKGVIAVAVAVYFGVDKIILSWVALAAFLGHLYPVFFHFRGGKGVATALGVLLVLSWPLGLMMLGTWLVVLAIFRISGLAAIVATLLLPLYGYYWLEALQLIPVGIMTALLLWRHRRNAQDLFAKRRH